MRIVVLDGRALNPGDNPWDPVAELGSIDVYDTTLPAQVIERAVDAEVVITNKTVLTATLLAGLPNLRLVAVVATGYDNVDIAAANARGVAVCNVPQYATDSVAQHVFALLLELCQQTALHDAAIRRGDWARHGHFSFWIAAPLELSGRVMGLVGFGHIGRRTAEIARAFGMRVICATRTASNVARGREVELTSVEELFSRSDVVSLHCPLTTETERIVNADMLSKMKPTALLINTSRGRLIDESALAAALHAGVIAGAGLDTLSREPPPDDHPLLSAPHCVITPHMAWASLAARRRLMLATAENIRAFLEGRPVHRVG